MDWLIPAIFLALTGSFTLVLVYLNLYLRERQKYLSLWLASWSLYAVRFIAEVLVALRWDHKMLVVADLLSGIWSAALLLWGTCLFSGKKLNSSWLALFAGGSLWVITGISFCFPPPWTTVPTFLLSACASILTGVALLRFKGVRGPAKLTAGWAFILWGLHKVDYPLLRPLTWAAPLGYLLTTFFGFVSALSIILIYLEKTKEELKASEEKYRSIFENAVEGIFQTTPAGRFLSANTSLARMYGYESPKQLAGSVVDLTQVYVDPNDREKTQALIREHGFVQQFETRMFRKDGEMRWVSINVRAVKDEGGEIRFYEGSLEDITERKRAEEDLRTSRLHLSDAADLARIAYWEHDEASNQFIFNDAFYALYATTSDREGGYRMARDEYVKRFVHPDDAAALRRRIEENRAHPRSDYLEQYEHRAIRGDGEVIHILARNRVIMDAEGRVVKTVGVNQDITERKKTEERLLIANFAMQSSISAISFADLGGRITYVNDSFLRLWGYDRVEEVLGKDISEFAMLGMEEEGINTAQSGRGYVGEDRARGKDGSPFYIQIALNTVRTDEGEPVCTMASFIDITARKRMEEALRESEAKFRSYVQSSPLAVIVADQDGRIVDVNRTTIELLGYDAATLSHMCVWELHPAEDREDALRHFTAFNRDGHLEAEFRFQRQDGSLVWVSLHATMIADGFSLAYCSDITSRKEAEEALRRYDLLSGSSRDIILFTGREGDILEANVAAEKAYGYSREEMLGFNVRDLRAPETMGLTEAQMTEADEQGVLFETTHRRRDGSIFPVEVSSQGATINGTRTLISVVRDISERKLAEMVLKESEESLRVFLDAVPHPAFLMDRDGTVIVANSALVRSLGVNNSNLKGKKILDLIGPGIAEQRKAYAARIVETGKAVIFEDSRAGRDFLNHMYPVLDYAGAVARIAVFALDVTEAKSLQAQLIHAQKMEAIGTLAGGVAHDFNNILTVIMGLGNLIQMSLDPGDRNRPYVDQIVLSSERAADLTKSLLAYSRKQRISLEPHRLGNVVASAAKLLKRLLPEDIELKLDLADGTAVALLDVSQVDQVLMNLATNARDAMPNGGSLTIRTDVAQLDEKFKETHGFGKPGTYVRVSFSDTGSGMDEKTMARVFDPFFTTKEVGKGTGLGLASAYGIVKQHDGYITVASALGKGTTFNIYLPLVKAAEHPQAANIEVKGGSETILVLEDDPDVRRMMASILSGQGYTMLEAANGNDALRVFHEYGDRIGLVILDVVMPGKNGKEVFDEIARTAPGVKAIFMSGYTGDVVIGKGVQRNSVDFLEKPLSSAKLLVKVREVLDR